MWILWVQLTVMTICLPQGTPCLVVLGEHDQWQATRARVHAPIALMTLDTEEACVETLEQRRRFADGPTVIWQRDGSRQQKHVWTSWCAPRVEGKEG